LMLGDLDLLLREIMNLAALAASHVAGAQR
jgi:hypothetical protein